MSIYVIADTHFSHKNILAYEPMRLQFARTIEEHDNYLIDAWNSKVNKKDRVYHLGDFSFGGTETIHRIAPKLNGNKILILGNHDKHVVTLLEYFKVFSLINLKYQGLNIALTHYPIAKYERYNCNMHGHMHSKTLEDTYYINCSIEQLPEFAPINIEEII